MGKPWTNIGRPPSDSCGLRPDRGGTIKIHERQILLPTGKAIALLQMICITTWQGIPACVRSKRSLADGCACCCCFAGHSLPPPNGISGFMEKAMNAIRLEPVPSNCWLRVESTLPRDSI